MNEPKDDEKKPLTPECEKKDDRHSGVRIEETKLGVWTMKLATEPGFNAMNYWKSLRGDLPLLRRLALDILNISPWLLTVYIICQIWQGIEDSISLQLSNNLLKTVSHCLKALHSMCIFISLFTD